MFPNAITQSSAYPSIHQVLLVSLLCAHSGSNPSNFLHRYFFYEKIHVFNEDDLLLQTGYYDKMNFRASAGIKYIWKELEIDVAALQLYNSGENLIKQYIFTMASYRFLFNNEQIRVIPSLAFRQVYASPYLFDAALLVGWKDRIWLEGSYISNKNAMIATGIKIESIKIAYAMRNILLMTHIICKRYR